MTDIDPHKTHLRAPIAVAWAVAWGLAFGVATLTWHASRILSRIEVRLERMEERRPVTKEEMREMVKDAARAELSTALTGTRLTCHEYQVRGKWVDCMPPVKP